MYLHRYKDESGTFYGLTSSSNPNNIKLLAESVKGNTIPSDRVKNFIQNIEQAFKEEPEDTEKKENTKKKASLSVIIRAFSQMLNSLDKE